TANQNHLLLMPYGYRRPIFIGLLYLIVGGLDTFLQYRFYILSKSLAYVVLAVMTVCVIGNYLSERK
ncbi:MAG TPA: hypothetical protein VN958_18260, partial [Chitinophagaceae bacterium]|nr:hypothetical protein [Chitinophagaceae bacterium]